MIKGIITMLSKVDGETESIRIAQGKNKLPTSWKDIINITKRDLRWRSTS